MKKEALGFAYCAAGAMWSLAKPDFLKSLHNVHGFTGSRRGYDCKVMPYCVTEAIKHLVHDYALLVAAGTDTQRDLPFPENHYAERTFLIHCRGMGQFFAGRGMSTDIFARDFIPGFARPVALWEQWREHVNKHVMHLTQGRIENKIPWTGEHNGAILAAFRTQWKEFLDNIKPEHEPLFSQELAARRQAFSKYTI